MTVLAGRYRLDHCIAIGAMGEVWKGQDLALCRPVAVKRMRARFAADRDSADCFKVEARCLAGLSHPGITKVYDYWETVPPFLVMELVDGPSPALALAAGPLAPWRALDVIAQVASALHACHRAGVIHCDVKPANLVMAPGGEVKLTDFGIAYAARSSPLTALGPISGTPAYLAPERVAGRSASPASDLYSLGVVMYECLTGTRPFTGATMDIVFAHISRPFPALPQPVWPAMSALLATLTAKEPEARPPTAGAVARRAAALRDELLPPSAAQDPPRHPAAASPPPTRPDMRVREPASSLGPAGPARRGEAGRSEQDRPVSPDSPALLPSSPDREIPARPEIPASAGRAAADPGGRRRRGRVWVCGAGQAAAVPGGALLRS